MTNKREDKYTDYFDDEEIEEKKEDIFEPVDNLSHNISVKNNQKVQKTQTGIKTDIFVKPDPPSVHRKLVKDVKDLQEMDLEELYSHPFSNSQFSKENRNFTEITDEELQAFQEYSNHEMEVEFEEEDSFSKDLEYPLKEQIKKLEDKYELDKENYDTLFKLIYLYKLNNEKIKLKNMREYTQNLFPLSDDMWLDWIKDELENAKDFDSRYSLIKSHFDKALNDFMCNLFYLIIRLQSL
jgi:hypothetical protein